MKSRRVATFAEEGKWTPGADSTLLVGDWQAWVDGEGRCLKTLLRLSIE